jgi:1,2-dihydroxy-3-keto-5-methylthiopentene dioxygenase
MTLLTVWADGAEAAAETTAEDAAETTAEAAAEGAAETAAAAEGAAGRRAPAPLVRTEDGDEIAAVLKGIGVRFERWPLAPLAEDAGSEEVLAAYREQVDAAVARAGYVLVDVARLRPTGAEDWPETAAAARAKFLNEHRHADDEDRFFAAGSGVFYLHVDGRVHAVLCEAGDLLSVPANTTHWFDMGTEPDFTAIRFFHDEDGWVGNFTGNPLAERIPSYDEISAARASRQA